MRPTRRGRRLLAGGMVFNIAVLHVHSISRDCTTNTYDIARVIILPVRNDVSSFCGALLPVLFSSRRFFSRTKGDQDDERCDHDCQRTNARACCLVGEAAAAKEEMPCRVAGCERARRGGNSKWAVHSRLPFHLFSAIPPFFRDHLRRQAA